jgi:hypothetical protein
MWNLCLNKPFSIVFVILKLNLFFNFAELKELLILYINEKSVIIILLYHVLKIKIRPQTNIWLPCTYM